MTAMDVREDLNNERMQRKPLMLGSAGGFESVARSAVVRGGCRD